MLPIDGLGTRELWDECGRDGAADTVPLECEFAYDVRGTPGALRDVDGRARFVEEDAAEAGRDASFPGT